MNTQEYIHLLAERTAIERLLVEMPTEDVLERSGLECRLEGIKQMLASSPQPPRDPARVRLTFRGRPVVGQHGIYAAFAAEATSAFAGAVAKVAAALSGPLAPKGPIPHRDGSQLLISGTAIGSFGFEFEAIPSDQLEVKEPPIAGQALELMHKLLQSTRGTDDELADSIMATDPRAIEAVRSFLEVLVTNDALCTLQVNDAIFQFHDVGDVRRSAQRLGQDNLHENQMQLTGEFHGVLPKGRTFEFELAETQEIIRGKVGQAIENPAVINEHLHEITRIDVLATRVGTGRPRYALMTLPAWQAVA